MAIVKNRFGKRFLNSGELQLIIFKDADGELLSAADGPYSVASPPSSTEFPNWATLVAEASKEIVESPRREELTNETWTPPEDTSGVNIKGVSITGSSYFLDSTGLSSGIIDGETFSFTSEDGLLTSGFSVVVDTGDSVTVEYTVKERL